MVTGISPDNEAFLDRVVATGQFPTREAALDEAVRALREKTIAQAPTSSVNGRTADDWIRDLREWSAGHRPVASFVDDSRESIY